MNQPNSSLNLDNLQEIVKSFRNKIPCRIVITSRIESNIKGILPVKEVLPTDENNISNYLSCGISDIPVYFDQDQKEDCLVFEDEELLKAYVNRKSCPEEWIKLLASRLLNQKKIDDLCNMNDLIASTMPPQIPHQPSLLSWHPWRYLI